MNYGSVEHEFEFLGLWLEFFFQHFRNNYLIFSCIIFGHSQEKSLIIPEFLKSSPEFKSPQKFLEISKNKFMTNQYEKNHPFNHAPRVSGALKSFHTNQTSNHFFHHFIFWENSNFKDYQKRVFKFMRKRLDFFNMNFPSIFPAKI